MQKKIKKLVIGLSILYSANILNASTINKDVPNEITKAFADGFSKADQTSEKKISYENSKKDEIEAERKQLQLEREKDRLALEQIRKEENAKLEKERIKNQLDQETNRRINQNLDSKESRIKKEQKIEALKQINKFPKKFILGSNSISVVKTKSGTKYFISKNNLEQIQSQIFQIQKMKNQLLNLGSSNFSNNNQNNKETQNLTHVFKGYTNNTIKCTYIDSNKAIFESIL